MPVTGTVLTTETPVGVGIGACTRSKIAAELVARGSQQAGSPVMITYPAVQGTPTSAVRSASSVTCCAAGCRSCRGGGVAERAH